MVEVDLDYPEELHDLHDTFPLAPENLNIHKNMLSTYQKQLAVDLGVKIGGEKLCLTLTNKKNYICREEFKTLLRIRFKTPKIA